MKGISITRIQETRPKDAEGLFVDFENELFYKISHYNQIPSFFMTIVSSSDVWNYLWSNGALTAGRINSDHAIFPYYTADKVMDNRFCTGSYTAISIEIGSEKYLWEPFSEFQQGLWKIERNLYKNSSGSKIYFEEINHDLKLKFQYGWMSSDKFGLVKHSRIFNNGDSTQNLVVLDGCRNILPACITSTLQNDNSVLLDAYKRTDINEETGLAIFSVTSIVTDKAEPSEGLYANISWFTVNKDECTLHLSPATIDTFRHGDKLPDDKIIKGERPSFLIKRTLQLEIENHVEWYQVFDTDLDLAAINELKSQIVDRDKAKHLLIQDIRDGVNKLDRFISEADGIQNTADRNTCIHHKSNVMFNIMRGGFFIGNMDIDINDFLLFSLERNRSLHKEIQKVLQGYKGNISYSNIKNLIINQNDKQMLRIFLEYMPLSFSRRHGDPSRPWNRFSIEIKDRNGNPKLNYQGNWRDIFQNWESLGLSYPLYFHNMIAKFLNACTADGFNPYRITRSGIDWEIQEPDNPWSNIGYWGDHQIIYLAKLIEWQNRFDRTTLIGNLNECLYSIGNVPYRIKPYSEIIKNPRSTILFDTKMHEKIISEEKEYGSDARLVRDSQNKVVLVSMTEKILLLILVKLANYVPGGGIWLNTQRPEWNDANNALAGYGLSMVTLYYLRRFLSFLKELYSDAKDQRYSLSIEVADFFSELVTIFSTQKPELIDNSLSRREFIDKTGLSFENMRNKLYSNSFSGIKKEIEKKDIIDSLTVFLSHLEYAIKLNRRPDGLYHAYNTMLIDNEGGINIHYLYEMLEGQVSVLSAGFLDAHEVINLCEQLKKSELFRKDQYSYILYPNRDLPHFENRNVVSSTDIREIPLLRLMLDNNDNSIVKIDSKGIGHFNPDFRNVHDLEKMLKEHILCGKYSEELIDNSRLIIYQLYEKTFSHQNFTGRSGTFYAYEGLGSIYWHMVTKLLLAVQENIAKQTDLKNKMRLTEIYYDIRKGIGFNKTPSEYGAFPTDPYSHTPAGQGAKQPGMTGQVKEEIITRWGELGIHIENGKLSIIPDLLLKNEFNAEGKLSFTYCNVSFEYIHTSDDLCGKVDRIILYVNKDGNDSETIIDGCSLSPEDSARLFSRNGEIKKIIVYVR
ncbi:MAG: hypothetical protein JXB24_00255 [Bacteroidales bacterium]|nr:hypothetical protein [Bacteroidales bacterium]